ncbi:MAG: hypothetical protein PVG66_05115 [Chromatiales bacterium]|jgi:hypothetical protein
MTVFQVKSSRSAESGKLAEFDVSVTDGELISGCEFVLFDTHHPCNFVVEKANANGELTTIQVQGVVPWGNRWCGAIVDTQNPDAAKKYGYSSRNGQENS